MSYVTGLRCTQCGRMYSANRMRYRCETCGQFLTVEYDFDALIRAADRDSFDHRPEPIMRRWLEFLPIENVDLIDRITLGESATPLLEFPSLSRSIKIDRLFVKNDTILPTASLKDRSMPLAVLKAVEFGLGTVCIVSSGNAAASLAAYAARAGISAVVFVAGNAPVAKLVQTVIHGAHLIRIDADYSQVDVLFRRAQEEYGWCDCNGLVNPFRLEGKRLYAHEICQQLGWSVPDVVVTPMASGNGVIALEKGFSELRRIGWIDRVPRLVGVQPAPCAPIAEAFRLGTLDVSPVRGAPTIAGAIAVSSPGAAGTKALAALRATDGIGVAVSDAETLASQQLLAVEAGLFAEPGGAVAIAAARKLADEGVLRRTDIVVCLVTGHGLKSVPEIMPSLKLPSLLPPEWSAVQEALSNLAG
jgi:threonine synthase